MSSSCLSPTTSVGAMLLGYVVAEMFPVVQTRVSSLAQLAGKLRDT